VSFSRRPPDDAPFRRDTKTAEESRADGFITGVNWDRDYRPGGPFIYSVRRNEHPDLVAYAALSKARHKAWHEGFDAGRKIVS
jgi:hypothetical protein